MAKKRVIKTKRKSPNARVGKSKPKQSTPRDDRKRWVEGIVLVLFSVYCYYAFITAQPTIVDKIIGKYILMYLFGNAVPVVCILGLVTGALMIADQFEDFKTTLFYFGLIIFNFMIVLSCFIPNLNNFKIVDLFSIAMYGGYGGIVGIIFAYLLNTILTPIGTAILVTVLTFVELFLIFKDNFPNIYAKAKEDDFGVTTLKDKFLDIRDDLAQKKRLKEEKEKSENIEPEELEIDEEEIVDYPVDDSVGIVEPIEVEEIVEEKPKRVKRTKTTDYLPPPTDLLAKPSGKSKVNELEIKGNAKRILETLDNFGVEAVIRNYEVGPSITRYEVKPAPGVKVSKIVNLADDLALALATSDIRIEAPIPGRDAIGIEVPNKKSDIVHLREIVESPDFKSNHYDLPFSLGKTLSGNSIIGDIAEMPHLLIAGSTGSGKSVCINSIIVSLLYRESPKDLKMILIDPKVVELSQYNDLPHLLVPVVTDPQKAAGALNWGIKEMEDRYALFSQEHVRDLESYNERMQKQGKELLPRVVIIIDELADLMMTSPKEVENSICRIAQKARACGIHLIIATQRPSVDVITGLIKSNIPSRIAFAVASNTDSRTILDTSGAEKLLGRGDMLYKPVGFSKPLRVQCSYVSDGEIADVIDWIKPDEEVKYDEKIEQTISEHKIKENKKKKKNKDPLYEDAVEVAFINNQISTSMLQRRLGIGYARAGRIIDTLQEDGIISGPNGSKPRKLLISKADYEQL